MTFHTTHVISGHEVERQGFVAECRTCGWVAWTLDHVDATRYAARHVALTARGE